jgi:hypothetical protein
MWPNAFHLFQTGHMRMVLKQNPGISHEDGA